MVKNLPAMWETQVQSLGWDGLLEKETATHSSTLAWRIPRVEADNKCRKKERIRKSEFSNLKPPDMIIIDNGKPFDGLW